MNRKPVICRFCRTDLRLKYGPKAPRCNVFAKLENKDLLKLHQNKDAKYVVIADCLTDLGKPLENKASIPSTSCLTCARSVIRLHAQLESLLKNFNLDTQLNSSSGTPRKSPRLISRSSIVLVSKRLAKSPTGLSPASKATKIAQQKSESHLTYVKARQTLASRFQIRPSTDKDKENQSDNGTSGIQVLTENVNGVQETEPMEVDKDKNIQNEIARRMDLPKDGEAIFKVFIGWPESGRVLEYQCVTATEKQIVKNLAYKKPRGIAMAVFRDLEIKSEVLQHVADNIKKEVKQYCNSDNCVKLKTLGALKSFNYAQFFSELKNRCPLFLNILFSCSFKAKGAGRGIKVTEANIPEHVRNAICTAAAVCLNKMNRKMTAFHYRNGLMLLNGGAKSLCIDRLSKLGMSVVHWSCINMQKRLAGQVNRGLTSWKQDIESSEQAILLAEEMKEKQQDPEDHIITIDNNLVKDSVNFKEASWTKLQQVLTENDKGLTICSFEDLDTGIRNLKEAIVPYKLVADNIDIEVHSRHQSKSHQNKSLHWTHQYAVLSRIPRNPDLDYHKPQKNVTDLDMSQILPSEETLNLLKDVVFTILISRKLVSYFNAYKPFSDSIVKHIPHKFSKEMATKSNQCLLGLQFLNPNKSAEMAEILKTQQQHYVPRDGERILRRVIEHGDQGFEERARNVQWTYKVAKNDFERLGGLEVTISEFHLKMCLFEVNNKMFLKEESAKEQGTTFSEMNRTESSNAKKGPKRDYNAYKDFHESETSGHILAAWMEFSGMEKMDDIPKKHTVPSEALLRTWSNEKKKDWLNNKIHQFLDESIFQLPLMCMDQFRTNIEELEELEREGFPCRRCGRRFKYHSVRVNHERTQHGFLQDVAQDGDERDKFGYFKCRANCGKTYRTKQGRNRHERSVHTVEDIANGQEQQDEEHSKTKEKPTNDYVYNYHIARLTYGLLIDALSDAVKEGDSDRILACLKMFLPILHVYGRTKYSYAVLLFLSKYYAILPEGYAHEILHDRVFNSSGKQGGNIPLDLRMEHLNRLLKMAFRQLLANMGEKGAQRIASSLQSIEEILRNINDDCGLNPGGGVHGSKPLREVVNQIAQDLHSSQAFHFTPGRKYEAFPEFNRDLLYKLDYREFYRWSTGLFKVWQTMYF